jgi:hypothetical protein
MKAQNNARRKRKHNFERGDIVFDSKIKFLRDIEPTGDKKRYIIGQCIRCDLIKRFRLDQIKSGKVKTCGCGWKDAVAEGKLTAYSVRARKNNPYLQRGGKHWHGTYLYVNQKTLDTFGNLTLNEIFKNVIVVD